ncbi:MAG: hypothetical protein BGO38_00215 [Cellulomonas sp. 73-145]|uniref:DsbA family protein n=1 Tax=Cellulomonas sp. 73-145 TaxID=1895739 RepID=UPI000929F0CE|nr:hypothetical protein [Cellulomonas sp. 73-145]OJV60025.1 MAG: hypothetical protein BGO38_00215 [Cellulomonas sp. 73-145]
MSYNRSAKQKVSRKQRRAEDRELARLERERRAARARRRRIGLRVGAVTSVVVVAAGVAVAVQAHARALQVGPVNMMSDGLLITGDGSTLSPATSAPIPAGGTPTPHPVSTGTGALDLVVSLDYGDPRSAAFWAANGSTIEQWVTSGAATLEIKPVALSSGRTAYTPTPAPTPTTSTPAATPSATPSPATSSSATPSATPTPTATTNTETTAQDYALRAANAFACVASYQPSSALAVNDALFTAQHTFGSAGLTQAQLVTLVNNAGVTSSTVSSCITSRRYVDWAQQATDRSGVTGVTVDVAGRPYTGSVDDTTAFSTFVASVYSSLAASASAATATPTPTATPAQTSTPTPVATPAG